MEPQATFVEIPPAKTLSAPPWSNALAKADDASLPAPNALWLLLNRTSFGMRDEQFRQASGLGFDGYLEQQLSPETIDDAGMETTLATTLPTLAMSNAQINSYAEAQGRQFIALDQLRAATLSRQIFSPRQLYETMVEFWSDHFNVQHTDGPIRNYKTIDDRDVIRRHALGKFPDMLQASAKSPAMLYYLDGFTNVVSGPNENYSRELMELHTLGLGGGYTEDDVKSVARAFTGWTIRGQRAGDQPGTFVFNPQTHDATAKQILGADFAPGRGVDEGEQVLSILANHPSTAAFIAKKLCKRFISDVPPQSAIDAVAATYRQSGGDIKAMLRTLFHTNEFAASADQKLKRPSEFFVGVLRTTGARLQGNWVRILIQQLNAIGHLSFMWPAPNGYPDAMGYWSSTSGVLARWNFALGVAENSLGNSIVLDVSSLSGGRATPESLVDALANRLLRRPLAEADRALFIGFAANGAVAYRPIPQGQLMQRSRELVGLMLASPYFQYR